ncbi:mechanosensitive ion channel domain-containing protein [Radicibacter daui]|uniref:mechanosensitive ion channel domain-containing protein n=1 Tax=Radicibacter daui TaxID=3064829 RepID=UPI004046D7AC
MFSRRCRLPLSLAAFLFAFLLQAAAIPQAEAQSQTAAAQTVDKAKVEALIGTLKDDKARQDLIDKLQILVQADQPAPDQHGLLAENVSETVTNFLGAGIDVTARRANEMLASLGTLPDQIRLTATSLSDPAVQYRWQRYGSQLAILAAIALGGYWFISLILLPWRRRLRRAHQINLRQRVSRLFLLFCVYLLPVVGMVIAMFASVTFLQPAAIPRSVALAVVNVIAVSSLLRALSGTLLVPGNRDLRPLPIGDETATYIAIWVRRLAAVFFAGYLLTVLMAALGISGSVIGLVARLFGLFMTFMVIALVLQNRRAVQVLLAGTPSGEPKQATGALRSLSVLRRYAAGWWHIFAILVLGGVLISWSFRIEGGVTYVLRGSFGTAFVLIVAVAAGMLAQQGLTRGFALSDDLRRRLPTLERRANAYLGIINWAASGLIILLAVLSILRAWGIDSFAWVDTQNGKHVATGFVTIFIVLALAVVVWEVVTNGIERYLHPENTSALRSARARTLLPLARSVFLVLLVLMTSLIVLSQLGIDIGPLLAGAGVVGLAIGFGSQALVRDFITGAFVLMEDQISVGDVVDVGGHSGVIEGISIRTLKLRDFSGAVHTVPFGQITSIVNMTKDFSFYVFEIGVAYREDIENVIRIIKEVGADLRKDPDVGPNITADIEVVGLDSFGDSAIVVKGRIRTPPILQWGVGRAFNLRLKRRFDEENIEIPFPHQTIYFGEDKSGNAPPMRIAGLEDIARRARELKAETSGEALVPEQPAEAAKPARKTPAKRSRKKADKPSPTNPPAITRPDDEDDDR